LKFEIVDVRPLMLNYPYEFHLDSKRNVKGITIHQSRTVDYEGIPFGTAQSIFDTQIKAFGWESGGYHYIISPNGKIEYALDEMIPGNHAEFIELKGNLNSDVILELNQKFILICLIGWFETNRKIKKSNNRIQHIPDVYTHPTKNQIDSLINLIQYLRAKHDFSNKDIFSHLELDPNYKKCPGPNFDIHQIRLKIQRIDLDDENAKSLRNISPQVTLHKSTKDIVARFNRLPKSTQNRMKFWSYKIFRILVGLAMSLALICVFVSFLGPISPIIKFLLLLPFIPWGIILCLRWRTPAKSSIMLHDIRMLRKKDQAMVVQMDWVDFDDISPYVVSAVCLLDDPDFINHAGLDWGALVKAFINNLKGEHIGGGSTITQQLMKNLYLSRSRSMLRKIIEIYLALLAEIFLSKRRIMELYLNFAQFGPGLYGIQSAARNFYGKSAGELSKTEASLLAVSLPNPIIYDVEQPSKYLQQKQHDLLQRMEIHHESLYGYFYDD
jgi:monofunctional biosynthetic peptidoglycan transglycosylase